MTFQIGDRVRGDGIVTDKDIHTVSWMDGEWLRLDGRVDQQWAAPRFELYARAGEFVVGDRVVPIYSFPTTTVRTVRKNDDDRFMEARKLHQVVSFDGDPLSYRADRFRLATPEEIAAPEAKPEPKRFNRIYCGNPHPVQFEASAEIPAANFDFSTIKAGDEVLMKFTVVRVAPATLELDHRGDAWTFFTRDIHSVIPAPKPKTLRERAIEAASGVCSTGSHRTSDIVDAVLAEVEKGK